MVFGGLCSRFVLDFESCWLDPDLLESDSTEKYRGARWKPNIIQLKKYDDGTQRYAATSHG
jgi:hypothetical protein